MNASQAINHLDSKKWEKTDIDTKIKLLKQVRNNVEGYMDELALSDTKAKNWDKNNKGLLGMGYQATIIPLIGQVNAVIDLYESIKKGDMMKALEIKEVKGENKYDLLVYPNKKIDKLMYSDRRDYIRVVGGVKQVNPLDKKGGIIAILGAGNYSSSVEMINAMFLDNHCVVHKPHHINQETDLIWEKIFKPLIDFKALTFCDPDSGRDLTSNEKVDKIYFTGGAQTANIIKSQTKAELISECGGNNPFFIVPSDRKWTKKEMKHQAMTIATMAKFNGGAICGRPQTIVTSKNWSQRREFIDALKNAIKHEVSATPSYYPKSKETFKEFQSNYKNAEVLINDDAKDNRDADMLFIEDVQQKGYATTHEAFTLVLNEVALDVKSSASDFMESAVKFANEDLLGTLTSCIIIDDETLKNNQEVVDRAITDLEYGSIGINTMPPFIFLNPYLTWGGNEEGEEIVSGRGNFGNLLNYENVEKSYSYSKFISPGHMKSVNKNAWLNLSKAYAKYTVNPKLTNLMSMGVALMRNNSKKKDF